MLQKGSRGFGGRKRSDEEERVRDILFRLSPIIWSERRFPNAFVLWARSSGVGEMRWMRMTGFAPMYLILSKGVGRPSGWGLDVGETVFERPLPELAVCQEEVNYSR